MSTSGPMQPAAATDAVLHNLQYHRRVRLTLAQLPRLLNPVVAVAVVAGLLSVARADTVLYNSSTYESGALGTGPNQTFVSTGSSVVAPILNYLTNSSVATSGLVFLTWYRGSVTTPTIVDAASGAVVYVGDTYTSATGFGVQQYKGESVLTYFSGDLVLPAGYGHGSYRVLDSSYAVIDTFNFVGLAANMSDLHEFVLTDDGTALMQAYNVTPVDLTAVGGPSNGYALDCLFQEIDVDSREVLFQWSALAHVDVSESQAVFAVSGNQSYPYDYCHMNSLEKDQAGNYLVSFRGLSAVYSIDGSSGDILWKMGGANNSFTFGDGVEFYYQHHARLQSDIRSSPFNMTLFDNGMEAWQADKEPYGRGLFLSVDTTAKTVSLLAEYKPSFNTTISSQGSVQLLDSGNILVGWGADAAFSEYTIDGTLVRDVQFAEVGSSSDSYRCLAGDWAGAPTTPPALTLVAASAASTATVATATSSASSSSSSSSAVSSASASSSASWTAYVSWNGDTRVATWVLADVSSSTTYTSAGSSILARAPRAGFETALNLSSSTTAFAAFGLNANGTCVGASRIVTVTRGAAAASTATASCGTSAASPARTRPAGALLAAAAAAVVTAVAVVLGL